MEEVFKKCIGFENLYYEVSNYGKIRDTKTGRYLKPYENDNGYLSVVLIDKNKNKIHKYMQRLVAETFLDEPKNNNIKYVVNHKDSNRQNNCVDNLQWATYSENSLHGYRYGYMENTRQAVIKSNTKHYVVYDRNRKFVATFYGLDKVAKFIGFCESTACNHKKNGKPTKNGYYIKELNLSKRKYVYNNINNITKKSG